MTELFYPLILLACPIGMGLMMLLMGKGMFGRKRTVGRRESADTPLGDGDDLAGLRDEQARISERIAAVEAARAGRDKASR